MTQFIDPREKLIILLSLKWSHPKGRRFFGQKISDIKADLFHYFMIFRRLATRQRKRFPT